jgi:hypothetical protein
MSVDLPQMRNTIREYLVGYRRPPPCRWPNSEIAPATQTDASGEAGFCPMRIGKHGGQQMTYLSPEPSSVSSACKCDNTYLINIKSYDQLTKTTRNQTDRNFWILPPR